MIKNLKSFDLKGKNILIRVDFNVPLREERVTNNFRIKSALPTINTCLEAGGSVVLMSHLGRPHGKINNKLSLISVGEELAGLLEMPIKFSDNCVSDDAIDTSLSLKQGEVHLLENLRFHAGEESNDMEFASRLARHGQIFINDAFGTAHRSHASNVGILDHFKHRGIGWLVDKEITNLERVIKSPDRPLTLILGGSKIKGKIGLIEQFLTKADNILIGGGMAFTFFQAKGKNIGGSLVEESMISYARKILDKANNNNVQLHLPTDIICGRDINDLPPKGTYRFDEIPNNLMGLDIGNRTINKFKSILNKSQTVVWNGPVGVFESDGYHIGTKSLATHLADLTALGTKTIIGGGDTSAAIEKFGIGNKMTHVSTGGGSSLELLSGEILPALQSLEG